MNLFILQIEARGKKNCFTYSFASAVAKLQMVINVDGCSRMCRFYASAWKSKQGNA